MPLFFTPRRLKFYLGLLLIFQICALTIGTWFVRLGYIDFRTFYTAGYMLRTGHAAQLYDYAAERHFQNLLVGPRLRALPMMSPPFTALLFAPLSLTGFWHAYAAFAVLNILLLIACFALLKPLLTALSARWGAAPALLFLSFVPAGVALEMGQLSFVLLLIFCASFVALRRNHDLLAGLILSFALIKFQIALPVAILFLLWRQWRFFAGFLTGGALLTALSFRVLALNPMSRYIHSLYSMTHSVTADPHAQLQFAILPHEMPNLYGFLFVLTRGTAWSHILILGLSLALFLWAALQRPSLPLALLTAMLVSYHFFFYDLTLLLLPLSLLSDHLLRYATSVPIPTSSPRDFRLLVTQLSLGLLFVAAAFLPILIYANETCWLAVPILVLTVSSAWWPPLHVRAPHSEPARALIS